MDDLISRQAAIDALKTCQTYLFDTRDPDKKICLESAVYELEQLPSAHPELNEWCHECKEYDKEHHCCPRWNRVIKTALADAQPDKTYEQGWKDGREALRKEIWEDGRDRLD